MAELGNNVEENINGQSEEDVINHNNSHNGEHDPHFEPIINLPEVHVPTMEEEEVELIKLRAKLYRYDSTCTPPEWKERGTGEVKLLHHEAKNTVRVVMRRDKTLKLCANHYVTPYMELKPNCGSDRAWVWSVLADYADEVAQPQLLAIRFANTKNAKQWKEIFDEGKHIVETKCDLYFKSLAEHLESLKIENEKLTEDEEDDDEYVPSDDDDEVVKQNNENESKPDDKNETHAETIASSESEKADQSVVTETQTSVKVENDKSTTVEATNTDLSTK